VKTHTGTHLHIIKEGNQWDDKTGLVIWDVSCQQFGDWQGLRWLVIVVSKSKEGKFLRDIGFASQVELVSNGRVGEPRCFRTFQSLSDCWYGFYAGIMIPNYRGMHLVIIVGRRASHTGFWIGCRQCHLGNVTKSDTQPVHLVGQLLELFL